MLIGLLPLSWSATVAGSGLVQDMIETVTAPAPPPPADTLAVSTAIETAYACGSGTDELERRVAASRAVDALGDRPSAAEMRETRSVVTAYVRTRQAHMTCFVAALERAKPLARSRADRDAIARADRDVRLFRMGQRKYELQILTRYVDRSLGEAEARLPY